MLPEWLIGIENPYRRADAPRDPWPQLILHYADGREPCNCGQAYYDAEGRCKHGCEANQFAVKEDIARRVLANLGIAAERPPLEPYKP